MAEIYEAPIPHFLNNVLSTPAGALPKGAQWIVLFDDLKTNILPGIVSALAYEKKQWQIQNVYDTVTNSKFQETNGCVYCQAISMPGDSIVVNPEGNIMSNSFLRSYVGQGRNQFPEMRMTFLETNISFADNFLRPWVISTANWGMLARERTDPRNYRTNAYLYKLGTYSMDRPPYILMRMTFYDICCVSVAEEEYNYAPLAGGPMLREAQFVYNYYNVVTTGAGLMNSTAPRIVTP